MTIDADQLYRLLPSIYRVRDAELGEPLRQLLSVVAEQAAVVEENIAQLHDDAFIETCDDWVAPYIGALIGYRPLHGVTQKVASPRAEVANTIGYRRRKGTAAVLEQLARDVSGWPARVVEYFQLVATAQHMNVVRPEHAVTPHLKDWEGLERLGSAFDPFARCVDVRSIERQLGRHNLPNIGVFVWRLAAFRRRRSPARAVDAQRLTFSPLGAPLRLFSRPEAEEVITSLAGPLNVPAPISRRVLHERLDAYYGLNLAGEIRSILVEVDGTEVAVEACNLEDDGGGGWVHVPADPLAPVAIDPVLGRIALPPGTTGEVSVTYHYGFSAPIGGGEYERSAPFAEPTGKRPRLTVPTSEHPTVQAALDDLPSAGGIVEIVGNGRFVETPSISAAAGAAIELRAANGSHPLLELGGDLIVVGGADARVTLDGLLVAGGAIRVPGGAGNELSSLSLRHVTLVPGRSLTPEGGPAAPGAPSLVVEADDVELRIDASILGPLRVAALSAAHLSNSIVDSALASPLDSAQGVAYAAPGPAEPASDFGGAVSLDACTVIGKLRAFCFELVQNSLLFAELAEGGDWPAPVHAERKQKGCMRFSYVPAGSIVPRRFRCQPQLAIDEALEQRQAELGGPVPAPERARIIERESRRLQPSFSSLRYGQAPYAQLRDSTAKEIVAGADDESEMGAFHSLHAPQREKNVRIRLEEYLRFGLEAGIFHES